MTDEQLTAGAVEPAQEGDEERLAAPEDAVAEAQEAPTPEPVDLSKFDEFRKYDANMQRKVAELSKAKAEAERRALEAQEIARRESAISRTRSSLERDGLDEQRIAEITKPLEEEVQSLRDYRTMREIIDKSGVPQDQIEQSDYGRSPEEFQLNLARKRAKLDLDEARRAAEDAKKEAERLKAETQKLAKEQELAARRESGADRVGTGEAEPRPSDQVALMRELEERVKRATSGQQVIRIKQEYRLKGLDI